VFDVDLISPAVRLLRLRPSFDAATIGTSPAAVKVPATPFLILIHRFSTF
jgi:hypothetical protein